MLLDCLLFFLLSMVNAVCVWKTKLQSMWRMFFLVVIKALAFQHVKVSLSAVCGKWTVPYSGSLGPDFSSVCGFFVRADKCKWSGWWQKQWKKVIIVQHWLVLAVFSSKQFCFILQWILLVKGLLKLHVVPGLLIFILMFNGNYLW